MLCKTLCKTSFWEFVSSQVAYKTAREVFWDSHIYSVCSPEVVTISSSILCGIERTLGLGVCHWPCMETKLLWLEHRGTNCHTNAVFLIASCLEVCIGSYIWVSVCVCVRASDITTPKELEKAGDVAQSFFNGWACLHWNGHPSCQSS